QPQPASTARVAIDVPPELDWQTFTVKSGDTLSTLFGKAGFNDALMYKVIRGDGEKLAQLFKGDELRFGSLDGELQEIVLVKSRVASLHTRLTSSGYVTKKEIRGPDVEFRFAAGVIDNPLFLAAREAGLDSGTTMELAGIFGWD